MKSVILIVVLAALSVVSSAVILDDGNTSTQDVIIQDGVLMTEIGDQDEALSQDDEVLTQVYEVLQDEVLDQDLCLGQTRSDVVGYSSARNRPFFNNIYNQVGHHNVRYNRNVTARGGGLITQFRITHLSNQGATVRVTGGGFRQPYITFRIQSQMSRGFNVRIEVWQR